MTMPIGANHSKVSLSLGVASPVLARQCLSLTLMLLIFNTAFSSDDIALFDNVVAISCTLKSCLQHRFISTVLFLL